MNKEYHFSCPKTTASYLSLSRSQPPLFSSPRFINFFPIQCCCDVLTAWTYYADVPYASYNFLIVSTILFPAQLCHFENSLFYYCLNSLIHDNWPAIPLFCKLTLFAKVLNYRKGSQITFIKQFKFAVQKCNTCGTFHHGCRVLICVLSNFQCMF